jgi:ribonuclease HI
MSKYVTVFSDGSSRGNPGPGGYGAIVVAEDKVKELGGSEEGTTNNRMELQGAISALDYISTLGKTIVKVHTDSSYVINGITKWVFGWKKNGWVTGAKQTVINRDLWEKLVDAVQGKEVEWVYVAGHSGIPGNERCDIIATSFADKEDIALYDGDVATYDVDVKDLAGNLIGAGEKKKKSKNTCKAYSYVSSVNGDIKTHATWAECEKRVKGVKATRFKKALSAGDEAAIIADFKKK